MFCTLYNPPVPPEPQRVEVASWRNGSIAVSIVLTLIVLLLFGANKLPELARGFGKSMREFKKAASGVEEEFRLRAERQFDHADAEGSRRALAPAAVGAALARVEPLTP